MHTPESFLGAAHTNDSLVSDSSRFKFSARYLSETIGSTTRKTPARPLQVTALVSRKVQDVRERVLHIWRSTSETATTVADLCARWLTGQSTATFPYFISYIVNSKFVSQLDSASVSSLCGNRIIAFISGTVIRCESRCTRSVNRIGCDSKDFGRSEIHLFRIRYNPARIS